jgi:hypothetical protein
LKEVGIDPTLWEAWLRQSWPNVAAALQGVFQFVMAHAEKIFGLAGFSFGVWRWWYYRESVPHKRLQEYLAEQERRLHQARAYVLEAILRPGPKRRFAEPLFAVKPLRTLLRRKGWRLLFGVRRIELGADRLLRRALRKIEAQLETVQTTLMNLHDQRASAHILRGAISSARAGSSNTRPRSTQLDKMALDDFRFALQVPGEHQVEAKEYEAHQLRRLGNLRDAEGAYKDLDALANRMLAGTARDLIRARARRWLASIAQAHACEEFRRGLKPTPGSKYANRLMTGQRNASDNGDDDNRIDATGALPLREPHGRPFQNRDANEQGDMHYLSAFIYRNLGFTRREGKQLDAAETSYRSVLNQTPTSRWFVGGSTKRLRAAAQAGLDRVNDARSQLKYDTAWLLPPSNEPQQPAANVSDTSSN